MRFKLGRFPDFNVDDARKECGKYLNKIEHGEDVEAARREAREELTLSAFFEVYEERHAKPHKRSWEFDRSNFTNHLEKTFGNRLLSGITQTMVNRHHARISQERGPVIANRVLSLLTVLFNKAREWGYYSRQKDSPTRYVAKYKEKARERFLQGEELPYFFEALQAEPNDDLRDYVMVSLFTGARKANVLSMTWHEIDLTRGEWNIPKTKNGDALLIPLVPQVVKVLQARRLATQSIFVFPSHSKKGHMIDPKRGWHRLLQAAKALVWKNTPSLKTLVEPIVEANKTAPLHTLHTLIWEAAEAKLIKLPRAFQDLHIHDLRRTLGSWQTIAGASAFIVGRSLGHKSLKSTQVYARLNLDPVRESITQATAMMVKMGKGK
jgi:integrase